MEAVDATVIHASIDKPNLAELEYQDPNPHLIALQFLTEKLERWMRGRQHELSQTVLLVADENHEQEQFSIDLIHQMPASGGPIGEWTSLAIPLDHFVDSVYFAQSNQNRGIQLADLVAFLLNRQQWIRRYSGKRRSDRAVDRLVKDHIDPCPYISSAVASHRPKHQRRPARRAFVRVRPLRLGVPKRRTAQPPRPAGDA